MGGSGQCRTKKGSTSVDSVHFLDRSTNAQICKDGGKFRPKKSEISIRDRPITMSSTKNATKPAKDTVVNEDSLHNHLESEKL